MLPPLCAIALLTGFRSAKMCKKKARVYTHTPAQHVLKHPACFSRTIRALGPEVGMAWRQAPAEIRPLTRPSVHPPAVRAEDSAHGHDCRIDDQQMILLPPHSAAMLWQWHLKAITADWQPWHEAKRCSRCGSLSVLVPLARGSIIWLSFEPSEGQATHLTVLLFALTGGLGTSHLTGHKSMDPARTGLLEKLDCRENQASCIISCCSHWKLAASWCIEEMREVSLGDVKSWP